MLNQETIASIRQQSKQLVIDIMCRNIGQTQAEDAVVDICMNAIYHSNTKPEWHPSPEVLAIRAHQKMRDAEIAAPDKETLPKAITPRQKKKQDLLEVWQKHDYDTSLTAEILRIKESALRGRLTRYGLNRRNFQKPLVVPDITAQTSMGNIEKAAILKALEKHNWHRKTAADELGISERTLYRKIARYRIEQ